MSTFMKNGFPFTPFTMWLKGYNFRLLKADVSAGIILSLLMAPQAMANAQIAGLPAYHGLYACVIPSFFGALFGAGRQLVTMPAVVICLLSSAALAPIASSGAAGYVSYIALLSLLVGLVQFILGILRMGVLVNFLSSPVLEGFINAVAIIIGTAQLNKLLGIEVEQAPKQMETVLKVLKFATEYVHWPTIGMGLLTLATLYLSKRYIKYLPNVLVAVILTSIISWLFVFEKRETVKLESIHSEKVVSVINSLESIQLSLQKLEQKKQALNKEATNLEDKGVDRSNKLEHAHQINVIDLDMGLFKQEIANRREVLRSLHFRKVTDANGATAFFPEGELPEGASPDFRQWHVEASQSSFDPAAIKINGGGKVIGYIPSGLPQFALPSFDSNVFFQLITSALVIAFIGFAESISISKSMGMKNGYHVDPNQELIGQGIANISSGFTLSPPCSGSFSVSAVNYAAGAMTGVSAITASLCILSMLFFLAPFLYHLPVVTLSVVVFNSVIKLLNFDAIKKAWTARWYDGVISIITFFATLYFAPELDKGILLGIVLTMSVSFYRTMHPKVVRLSSGPDFLSRDAEFHDLDECDHIAVLYFQQDLIYSNAAVLEDHVLERMEAMPYLKHMHFVCNGINDIDASGEETLHNLVGVLHKNNVTVSLSGLTGEVADVISRTGLLAKIGDGNIFRGLKEAICTVHARIHPNNVYCKKCPWNGYCGVAVEQCTLDSCAKDSCAKDSVLK